MHMFILHKSNLCRPVRRCSQILLMILFVVVVTCVGIRAESHVGAIFSNALPTPKWRLEGQPYRYDARNLYEYINGAAEFYIAFGFIELMGANYAPVSGHKDAVTIDVYDMGSKLNAFGLFQSRRDDQASVLNFGALSIGSDDYLAFQKDRFYVEIQAYIVNKKELSAIKTMAAVVAEHLPGDNTLPQELLYLPEKGRIAGSERYIKGGILGHSFLDPGLTGNYQINKETVTVFIAMLPSNQAAEKAIEQHRSFLDKSGRKCRSLDGFGNHAFVSEEPYHKNIIATQAGAFVIGVFDLNHTQAGKTLLADILLNITGNRPVY